MNSKILEISQNIINHIDYNLLIITIFISITLFIANKLFVKKRILKLRNNKIIFLMFIVLFFYSLFRTEFNYFVSFILIILIVSSRELVNNVLIGFVMRFKIFKTAININDIIKIENKYYKVLKINSLKTFLLNINTEDIISIQNKDLVDKEIEHKVFDKLDIYEISFEKKDIKLIKLDKFLKRKLQNIIDKEKIDFKSLKEELELIKYNYSYFPDYKPRYEINYEVLSDKINVNIKLFTYSKLEKNDLLIDLSSFN